MCSFIAILRRVLRCLTSPFPSSHVIRFHRCLRLPVPQHIGVRAKPTRPYPSSHWGCLWKPRRIGDGMTYAVAAVGASSLRRLRCHPRDFAVTATSASIVLYKYSVGRGAVLENESKAVNPPFCLPKLSRARTCLLSAPGLSLRRQLIELGAWIDAPCRSNATPFHLAVQAGHLGAVRLLAQNNADLEARDWLGRTALHHACDYARMNGLDNTTAFVLIGAGADVHSQDIFWFVIDVALTNGFGFIFSGPRYWDRTP